MVEHADLNILGVLLWYSKSLCAQFQVDQDNNARDWLSTDGWMDGWTDGRTDGKHPSQSGGDNNK